MSILTGINIFYLSFDSLAVAANWNNISFLIRIIFDTKYDDEIRKIKFPLHTRKHSANSLLKIGRDWQNG